MLKNFQSLSSVENVHRKEIRKRTNNDVDVAHVHQTLLICLNYRNIFSVLLTIKKRNKEKFVQKLFAYLGVGRDSSS